MIESKHSHYQLSAEGKILWQEKFNNPLPGVEVASLVKGDHPMRPDVLISSTPATDGKDHAAMLEEIKPWLRQRIDTVLEPLAKLSVKLSDDEQIDEDVQAIISRVYDAMGVVLRQDVEGEVAKIDAARRGPIRSRKINMGPVFISIPALNKPAAVKMRGLLWNVFHEKPLPAPVPPDGVTSYKGLDTEGLDAYFRTIGYPVMGKCVVRIDMLDRVINRIYEIAKGGTFEAQHQMSEWLGTTIEDLYSIIEALGHVKIDDGEPAIVKAEQASVVETSENTSSDIVEIAVNTEAVAQDSEAVLNQVSTEVPSESEPVKKPKAMRKLATFRLKRGKPAQANAQSGERKPYKKNFSKTNDQGQIQTEGAPSSKPYKKFNKDDAGKKDKFDRKKDGEKSGKPFHDKKHKDKGRRDRDEGRVISIEAKRRDEDNPFAILQQLVVKKDA